MKTSWLVFICIILSFSICSFAAENQSLIENGAHLQKLVSNFSFTEGPAVDSDGNIFFTDQPNNQILKYSKDGTLSVFLSPCGRANGLYFDRDGNLWACADELNELWKIDPQGNITVVITHFNNKLLNGPNDLWIMRDGCIYFTDPLYSRNYWNHRNGKSLVSGEHVYYLKSDMQTLIQVTDDLQQPNGIIGTPDGRFLYVADYGANKTYRYTIQSDGTLSEKTFFCNQGSDGMTIDNEGNLYLTRSGVAIFNSAGDKIQTINVSEGTTNVTFGGPDGKTLYITAGKSLYSIEMSVKGAFLKPDFNYDEHVNFSDYARQVQLWKLDDPNVDLGPTTLGDGVINNSDLKLFAENWLQEIFPIGLRAYWKLDETEGDIAFDSSPGLFDALVIGDMLWRADDGLVNGALELDGIDDYISTPFVLDPAAGAFSVFACIISGLPGRVILSQNGMSDWLYTDSVNGTLTTNIMPSPGRTPIPPLTCDVIVTDGQWHRVGLVWTGTERILYVDDIEVARDIPKRSPKDSNKGFNIGTGNQLDSDSYWSGLIDDVRIYDHVVVPQ